jgi:hypothetical protein
MKIKIQKLSGCDPDTCCYQLMVYQTENEFLNVDGVMVLQPMVYHVSVVAKINRSSLILINEDLWVRIFKSCLTEYKKLNSTIRKEQILSNLEFVTRGYDEYVDFMPLEAFLVQNV